TFPHRSLTPARGSLHPPVSASFGAPWRNASRCSLSGSLLHFPAGVPLPPRSLFRFLFCIPPGVPVQQGRLRQRIRGGVFMPEAAIFAPPLRGNVGVRHPVHAAPSFGALRLGASSPA